MRTLAHTRHLSELASSLYPWLPGSNHPYGRTYTFADAAEEVGLASAWKGGSKLPALQHLLEVAYDKAALRSLILLIVREGIKYRDRGRDPICREDVAALSSLTRALGLRVPELEEAGFVANLPPRKTLPRSARRGVSRPAVMDAVKSGFEKVMSNPDAQSRGYDFQAPVKAHRAP